MASFPERRRVLVDLAFATFGQAAILWSAQPKNITVRFKSRDEDDGFGPVRTIDRSTIMRLRSWEVAEPPIGTEIEIKTGPDKGTYKIAARPMLDSKGVWDCPMESGA